MNKRRFIVRIKRGDNPIMDYELLTQEQAYFLYDMCLNYEETGWEYIHASIYDAWTFPEPVIIENNKW